MNISIIFLTFLCRNPHTHTTPPRPFYCQRAGPPNAWSANLLFPSILGHTETPVSPPASRGGSSTAVFVLLFMSPQVSISVLNLVPPQGRYLFTVHMVNYLSGTWEASYLCIFHFQAVQSSGRFTVLCFWRYMYSDRCKETEHGLYFAFREGRPYSLSPLSYLRCAPRGGPLQVCTEQEVQTAAWWCINTTACFISAAAQSQY